YVGGTFAAAGGTVTRTGGEWVIGEPGTTLVLPDGVTADQVQGLRFTFTRADGAIWENPSTPRQTVNLSVQRRVDLRTGGPVPSDLAGNAPAPGEDAPGETADTIQGENRAADTINGEPLTADDDDTDTIRYRHANNAVEVAKSPTGAQAPGQDIPYTLTFTNTGDVAIFDPVITDRLPSDSDGPLLVLSPDTTDHYTYALDGDAPTPPSGLAMPTDAGQVSVDEQPDLLTFTFPQGTVLEVGQSYTITVALQFRTGLPSNTEVTNTTGISGDRAWDDCDDTLDDDSGECQADTTVYPVKAGALRGVKSVQADDDELGVLNTRDDPDGCTADDEGFFVAGCVPVTKPGGEDIWRMRFTNTGNLPQDKVYAIDRLPTPDDTGAITTLPRDSQWTPTPQTLTFVGASLGEVTALRVYYDTDQHLCTLDLETLDGCPENEWTLSEEVSDPADGYRFDDLPEDATALLIEADFAGDEAMLPPAGTLTFDLTTTAPAQSPTAGADPIAWNTVAVAAETVDGDAKGLSPKSEGNKVGVALATGPLEVIKQVEGAAAEAAPTEFTLEVTCRSVGEDVRLGDDAEITVAVDEPYRIDDLPWGSECTVTEDGDAVGNPDFTATTVTVGRDTLDPVRIVATNTYRLASLSIAKEVEDSAVDQDGNPISYGPFTFTVDCTFLDEPVYAAGYSADHPMEVTFDSEDDPVTFTELPAGSECSATETENDGADDTTSEGTTGVGGDDEKTITGGTTIELVLTPDGENPVTTNTVTFTNTFPTGSLTITKEVTGSGAETYGAGPFTVQLTCVDENDADRTVFDSEIQLGGDQPLSVTVENLYVVSTCEVTETGTGGATTSAVSPEGEFEVTADSAENPVVVTVTNRFDVGSLRVIKKIEGDELQVGDDRLFWFQLSCELTVNGEPTPVEIENDGEFNLSIDGGLTQTFDGLPTGAVCTVTETDDGGADASIIEPGQVVIGDGTTVDVLATNTF
ncbi:MAG: DUF5979 domain-containing protein, partial [Microlunatus sp.]|nr:DUF5979 domain-containing protein [Microlunatus sp.]